METIFMVNQNDATGDTLLQQVIGHLRQQEIPDFPDPEIAVSENAKKYVSSVHSISPLWRILMNRRFELSAAMIAGLAAVLGFLLLWGGSVSQPVSAMEKMAEEVRKAKSYKCLQVVTRKDEYPDPGEPSVTEDRYTVYWLAPGSARTEIVSSDSKWKGPGPECTEIYPAGKPSIHFDHRTKKFYRRPPLRKGPYSSALDDLENLSRLSGKATRDLGTKEISGKIVRGFEIEIKKVDPEGSVPGRAEIWLDPQSNLPVLVRCDGMKGLGYSNTQEDRDIQWNIDLDPKLFDPTPPAGYTDATPKRLTSEEQVRQVTDMLKVVAEARGGRYPPEKTLGIDTIEDFFKMLGLVKWPRDEKEENAGKASKAYTEFGVLIEIQACNPDFAYNGKTVGPNDKDKVLLRWKLDDGRYEVIFGDLRAETVTAERLRALEGKQAIR
jgi:outer membrane lipoprotein-sorting protein